MGKIAISFALTLMMTFSCATPSAGQPGITPSEGPAVSSQRKSAAEPGRAKGSNCVKAINQFGNPISCICEANRRYNPMTGDCERAGRICTQSISEMFYEKTGSCYTARNGCESSDLKARGWREKQAHDVCKP